MGFGSSAGGLDALVRVLKAVPPDLGFAYVAVQHLSPELPSHTAEILSRVTPMPVQEIRDGVRAESNQVYVIPPGKTVKVESGLFRLAPRKANGPLHTIDELFGSLATEGKSEAIAVVLSGTGNDGSEGLAAVKEAGGLAIVQDPSSASHDGMPQSAIEAGAAMRVLRPEEIGEEIARVARSGFSPERSVRSPPAADDREALMREIFELLQIHAHMDFSSYKASTVSRRIERQMRTSKRSSLAAYVELLRASPAAVKKLADEMFIHVTAFFRDPDSFDYLKEKVLPRLLKNRAPGAPLRIWVPGCSTGEEPYSIAMALVEVLGSKAATTPIQIFATDISEAVVQKARTGLYRDDQLEGMSPGRLAKFFDKEKEGRRIKKAIRDLCVFSRHDVASSPPFARIDLLSCRNLLIYFAPALQKRVMPVFHYALNPEGVLWLGKSEAPTVFAKLFTPADKTHSFYHKSKTAKLPGFKFPTGKPLLERLPNPRKAPNPFGVSLDSQRDFERVVMARYAPAGVMINGNFEILQLRGRTGPYLELPPGQPSHDFLKLLKRELLPAVRSAVKEAGKDHEPVRREGLCVGSGKERRVVNVEVIPVAAEDHFEGLRYLVIFEEDRTGKRRGATVSPPRERKARGASLRDSYSRQLLDELDSLRDHQQSLTEGYEASQEELTSANEELQSANEELQSTNEEMETAKEELQAANEELTTLNEELQNRNAELTELNERLALSEERFRLLVTSVKDYAIFLLDPEGRVATWNEGARRFKGYEESEILGKHFSIFYPPGVKEGYPDFELKEARAKGRYEDEGWRVRKDGSRFWANVVITRINDSHGNLIGFSKITRDLTERKEAEERYRLLVEGVKDYAIFRLDPAGNVVTWNEGARRMNGYAADQIIGKNFSVLFPEEDQRAGRPEYDLRMAATTGRHEAEGWRVRRDGTRYWANSLITRIDDAEGKLVGFSKVTRDQTERKRMEDELRKARDELETRVQLRTEELTRALRVRDEFLSIASHELKTPLTSLKLQLQMTQRKMSRAGKEPPRREELLETFAVAIRQTNSLNDLVEYLLDTSRIRTGTFTISREEMDLTELTRDVLKRFAEQFENAGCVVEANLAESVRGEWDRHRIEQVLVNLLSNAIKYAPGGMIQVNLAADSGRAIFSVKDSGPGIPRHLQEKVFDRFERADADRNIGGLGLGLFIVRTIVEAHGGKIRLESEEGKGAKFELELPQQAP